VTKSPPPKRTPKDDTPPPKTGLLMSTEQSLALKTHLKQYRDDLPVKDQPEFNKGPLGKILAVL